MKKSMSFMEEGIVLFEYRVFVARNRVKTKRLELNRVDIRK